MSENVHNNFIKKNPDWCLVDYACNPSTLEANTGGLDFWGQSSLHSRSLLKKMNPQKQLKMDVTQMYINVLCAHMELLSSVKGRKCSLKLKTFNLVAQQVTNDSFNTKWQKSL
jgi:hypothetical protein